MATQPGSPAAAMPVGEDALVRRFADLERFVRELGPSIARSFSGTVADLQAAQTDLATAQGTLADTVAGLATTQDDLADAVATLQGVVDAQLLPKVSNGSGSGFSISTTNEVKAHSFVTVPAGYSKALISVSGAVTGSTNASGGDRLYANIIIDGISSPATILNMSVNNPFGSVSAFGTASLSGLDGGSISIDIASKLQFGPSDIDLYRGLNTANLSATAIFLR